MKKQKSGSRKMMDLGKKASLLWLTPADMELVKSAAKLDRRSVANFILNAAVKAAKLVLDAQKEGGDHATGS